MKKIVIVMALALTLFSSQLYAADNGLYIGIGGGYAFQQFDSPIRYNDSLNLNAKAGYRFNHWLSAELVFDSFPEFSTSNVRYTVENEYGSESIRKEGRLSINTLMIAGKVSRKIYSRNAIMYPYITAGIGIMKANDNITASIEGYDDYSVKEEYNGTCAKIGLGIDFDITRNISIGFEGSYVMGFGDVDKIKYMNIGGNVSYHF